jgi:hypothetical protein
MERPHDLEIVGLTWQRAKIGPGTMRDIGTAAKRSAAKPPPFAVARTAP